MQKTQGGLGRGLGALLPTSQSQLNGDDRQAPREPMAPRVPLTPQPRKASDTATAQAPAELKTTAGEIGDRVVQVAPDTIVANPRQPRTHFREDDLTDLMASVQEHGILQPLVVSVRDDGKYELIAGERRLRSARAVGLRTVPVVVRNATDRQKLEWALIENIQRADLNAVEEARAYQALIEDFSLTQEDVAGRVGKSRSQIANTLRLLELPQEMLDAVIDGSITKSHARTLLAEPDPDRRRALFLRMKDGGMTVRGAESSTTNRRLAKTKDANIAALETELRERLGTKVVIDVKGSASTITIHCYSKDDLAEMIRRLR